MVEEKVRECIEKAKWIHARRVLLSSANTTSKAQNDEIIAALLERFEIKEKEKP